MLPLFLLGAAAAGSGGLAAGAGAGAAAGLGAAAAKGAAGSAGSNLLARLFGREPEPPKAPYQLRSSILPANSPNPFEGMLSPGMMPRKKIRILSPNADRNFIDPRYAQLLGG